MLDPYPDSLKMLDPDPDSLEILDRDPDSLEMLDPDPGLVHLKCSIRIQIHVLNAGSGSKFT
jgi:hypothetical protein